MMTSLRRHRMPLKSFFAGSLILMSMLLTSCSMMGMGSTTGTIADGNNGKNCMNVGVLLPETTSSVRWQEDDAPDLTAAINTALPHVHLNVVNAGGDTAKQFGQAETALENGACMLVVAPHDSIASANIVELAKAHDVPVIAYDRLIQSKDLNYYVSFNNFDVGVLQATYIAQHYQDPQFAETNAKIVMISGAQTDTNALMFSNGVHSILDPMFASGQLNNVYETFTPDWNNSTAQTEMETYLSSHGSDLRVAYVANDGMASSVITALKGVGMNGKVLVTGQDATAAGINNILAGNQSMTVYKPIVKEANSVGALVKAIHDGTNTQFLTAGLVTPTYDNGSIPSILDTPQPVDFNTVKSTVIKDHFLTKQAVCQGLAPGTGGVC